MKSYKTARSELKRIEVNLFGLIDITTNAVEVMRDQKSSGGLIQQVTSTGGQGG